MLGRISKIIVHGIGNKVFSEGIRLSNNVVNLAERVRGSLCDSFNSIKFSEASFQFFHESGELQLNPMYVYVERIFNNPDCFLETSFNIARQLYESSEHPKIHEGELMIVLFDNCEYRGKQCKAIGLFKTEKRDKFFDFEYNNGSYSILEHEGLNQESLEKGAVVYDLERNDGYNVGVLMQASKQVDAKYWLNDFLHITQTSDSFYKTQQIISLTKNYIKDVISKDEGVSKVEQTEFLSRAMNYLAINDNYEGESFCSEVFRDERIIDGFNHYGEKIEGDGSELMGSFELDKSLVKKKSRCLKSVIKLDKNFHIYVHGGEGLIKRGFDEATGMEYYQLYFKNEE